MPSDLTGQIFSRLTVLRRGEPPLTQTKRTTFWWCRCQCGKKLLLRRDSLTTGNTKSCGCLSIDVHHKHGMYGTPEYIVYHSMLNRCTNPNNQAYERYGGRGIKVCARWSGTTGFINFLSDMGTRPGPRYQLDRRNNEKGYSKTNCRWVTPRVNSNNTSTNHRVRYKGETLTIAQWSRRLGLSWTTVANRLQKGWSLNRALKSKVQNYG